MRWNFPCVANLRDAGDWSDVATLTGLECAFENVLGIILGLASIILFVMLITGSFKYMASGGDPKAVEAAKKTFTYAIAGLVVLILAFLFLQLIYAVTGVDVRVFRIYKI